jgi:hypothetical protein
MTDEDRKIVAHMRARVEQCRRLAQALTDKNAAAVLLKMADEGEADIARLEGREATPPNPLPPVPDGS